MVFAWTGISTLRIPPLVEHVGMDIVDRCDNLTDITVDEANEHYASHDGILFTKGYDSVLLCPRAKTGEVNLPEGTKHIKEEAFAECSITSLSMPNTVVSLGIKAFSNSRSLEEVKLSEALTLIPQEAFDNCQGLLALDIPESVTRLENNAFSYCKALKEVVVPDNVQYMGDNAFSGCSSLETISLPDSLKYISIRMLAECSSLKSLEIPSSVDTIDQQAFMNCGAVTNLKVPESVVCIGERAFALMSNLKTLELPSSLRTMGMTMFFKDTSLTDIVCRAPEPPVLGDNAFNGVNENLLVTVPCGSLEAYRDAAVWSEVQIQDSLFYTLEISVNDTTMGSVVVEQAPDCADMRAQLRAVPATGYVFVKWSDGSTENPYWVDVESDVRIMVEFAKESATEGDVQAQDVRVYARDGMLRIENVSGSSVGVYDVMGREVFFDVQGGESSYVVPVPCQGVYLVRVGTATYKVFVR